MPLGAGFTAAVGARERAQRADHRRPRFHAHVVDTVVGRKAYSQAGEDAARRRYATQGVGVWDDVLIVVITEFGRRTGVNGSAGTDHGHAFTTLLAGGAIAGGSSYGPDLTDGDLTVASGYPAYAVDFRSIYKEAVQDHLGADAAPVFPEALAIENVLNYV